ncbi:MAG TPA: VTT domain-containing protein [Kofleriaceae bacterium]|jgi:uncharacterized membrane protein YdjX (TVP38/TMEM64 family)|nr:VTT domain-containing protein [Kofleriaceae bacterium]
MMPSRAFRRVVLGVLIVAFVGGAIYLWRTGAVTASSIRAWLDSLGPAAPALFVAAFIGGAFVGLPGMAFVVAGRLAFGPWLGFVLGFGGGLLAVTLPFVAARLLRRNAGEPWRPRGRLAARAYALLETHPFVAVVLLRLILWFNPPLSYALALTPIRLPVYVAACAVALAPVVAVAMIATSWFL